MIIVNKAAERKILCVASRGEVWYPINGKENRNMKNWLKECRNTVKVGILGLVMACLLPASVTVGEAALPASLSPVGGETVSVYINGVPYAGDAVLYRDSTYVEMGEFTAEAYLCRREVTGDTLTYRGDGLTVTASDGCSWLEANGRYLWCESGVFVREEKAYVPIRAAAKAIGARIRWDGEEFAAYVETGGGPITPGDRFYIEDEVYWLARIIHAEAGAEPFRGQIAVGNVVLNRVRSELFPDTIYAVIFDRKNGVQFTPTVNGMIYRAPDGEAIIAAKLCLEGYSLSHEILYFLNEALSENLWVPRNRPYVMTISGHDFYS